MDLRGEAKWISRPPINNSYCKKDEISSQIKGGNWKETFKDFWVFYIMVSCSPVSLVLSESITIVIIQPYVQRVMRFLRPVGPWNDFSESFTSQIKLCIVSLTENWPLKFRMIYGHLLVFGFKLMFSQTVKHSYLMNLGTYRQSKKTSSHRY